MRHDLQIVRGIYPKGAGIAPLRRQYLTLGGIGIAILLFATTRFRKRIAERIRRNRRPDDLRGRPAPTTQAVGFWLSEDQGSEWPERRQPLPP